MECTKSGFAARCEPHDDQDSLFKNKVSKPRKTPFKHAHTTRWCLYKLFLNKQRNTIENAFHLVSRVLSEHEKLEQEKKQ